MTYAYPVFGVLREKSVKNCAITILGSLSINTFIYLPVGMFGYLKNGRFVSHMSIISLQIIHVLQHLPACEKLSHLPN